MLGKLLKHEFFYFLKRFVPLYIGYLLSALCIKIIELFDDDFIDDNIAFAFVCIFLAFAFVGGTVGLIFYALFGNVSRFHKNLFTDEGYLMNTLPVPTYYHILCKLISALIWYAITSFVVLGAICIVDKSDINIFAPLKSLIVDGLNAEMIVTFLDSLVAYCAFLLLCYMCEAIGSAIGNTKIVPFFVGIGLWILNSVVVLFVVSALAKVIDFSFLTLATVRLIYYVIVSFGLFLVTNYILKEHFNIE